MLGIKYIIQINIRSNENGSFSLTNIKDIVKKEDNNIKLQKNNVGLVTSFKSKHSETAFK